MTNFILWAVAGGIVGWIGYSFLQWNEQRSLTISIVIGVFGAFFGGKVLAPILGADAALNPADFQPFPLIVAMASAAAILIATSMIHRRFGI